MVAWIAIWGAGTIFRRSETSLTLPATGSRPPFTELRQDDLIETFVEVQTTYDSDGDPWYEYHVTLRHRSSAAAATARLARFLSRQRAAALCEWLNERLKLISKL